MKVAKLFFVYAGGEHHEVLHVVAADEATEESLMHNITSHLVRDGWIRLIQVNEDEPEDQRQMITNAAEIRGIVFGEFLEVEDESL